MKRKQPSRSKRQPSRRERRAVELQQRGEDTTPEPHEPAPQEQETPSDGQTPEANSDRRLPISLTVYLLLIAVVTVFCGLAILQFSLRYRATQWPTTEDVGLQLPVGAAGVVLLLVGGGTAWFARRAARSGRRTVARFGLVITLVCAVAFLGLRVREFQGLHARGLWRRSVAGPIHERADAYYLQAVRLRLNELFQSLEEKRVNQPNEFTDEDANRLEMVSDLQKNLVVWSEQEVGHWLNDLQSRRDVMDLTAYQIYPLARMQEDMSTCVQERRRYLAQQRQWFSVLEDYCGRKQKLLSGKQVGAEVQGEAVSESNGESPKATEAATVDRIAALDQELNERLDKLGLADWPYASFVRQDTTDIAMAGERSNQIAARLSAIRDREEFLDRLEEPGPESAASSGLNLQYRWLRLPVCLPGGNLWAGGFFALTFLHVALIIGVFVLSLVGLLTRFDAARFARHCRIEWWAATVLVSVVILLLFYFG